MFNIIEWLYLKQKNNLAYYDSLTGCKNRTYYDRVIKRKYYNKKATVIFIDINNLKKINDTKGHAEGSKKIKFIAACLNNIICDEVIRYGGDEFIMINCIDISELDDIPDISYGVIHKEEYEDMSSAIRKADESMYKMKVAKNGLDI